jgi:hypothetical protein
MPPAPKGRRGGRLRRLADMAMLSKRSEYHPPPRGDCDEQTFQIPLADADALVVRLRTQRGRIVDFAVTQTTKVEGKSVNVARIDCCWGKIHRHQYDQDGTDLLDHQLIREIPPTDGCTIVEEGYVPALDIMHNDWEGNLRRWRGDRT